MSHGFLGNDSSFMLDVVVCALLLIVPTLLYSLFLVKVKKNYLLHRNLQLGLGAVLFIAVSAFEIDMQLVHHGWENVVNKPGQPVHLDAEKLEFARTLLWVHLIFAVTTPVFWATTIFLAMKRFPSPPVPNEHSGLHRKLGWISAVDITLTSVTGLIFYYFAFIA
jgi:uncharacterized membrane protein YozB (DUF420 family)